MEKTVFSEFEVDLIGIKVAKDSEYKNVECIGSYEEEMNIRTITKKCRGIVKKKIVKGTGEGTLKISAHIPYALYTSIFGMDDETNITGVKSYGTNSVHPEFSLTAHVTDEDGDEKYKAYPKCVIETGVARKVENGGEEVAELELTVSVMPDEYGKGMYEALASELTDEEVKETWMTAFTPALVQKVAEA